VQKSHTKVLLLFFFRSHEGAADSPFGRSSADDVDRSNADVAGTNRESHCLRWRSVYLGFLEAFFRTFCLAPPAELRGPEKEVGMFKCATVESDHASFSHRLTADIPAVMVQHPGLRLISDWYRRSAK
jgi:hypothetical protein